MNVCACIGAVGDDPYCPCEMKRKGLTVTITETFVSKEVWDCLSDDDKNTINQLKLKAFGIYFTRKP